jgi:GNAT superfamily N-acetyltransferase
MASAAPGDDTFLVRGGIIEVVSLVVAQRARGEGIGRQLMRAAEQLASNRGFDTIRVAVMAGNDRAGEFYGSLGYSPAEHVLLRAIALHQLESWGSGRSADDE